MDLEVTIEEALSSLRREDPIPVHHVDDDGRKLDEGGCMVDPCQTANFVWALGPFGSWAESLEMAREEISVLDGPLQIGKSFRIGAVVLTKPGWGFAIEEELLTAKKEEWACGYIGQKPARSPI